VSWQRREKRHRSRRGATLQEYTAASPSARRCSSVHRGCRRPIRRAQSALSVTEQLAFDKRPLEISPDLGCHRRRTPPSHKELDLSSKVEIGPSPPADELLRKSTRAESRRLRTRTTPLGGSLPDGVTRCSLQMRQVVLPIDSDPGSTVRAGYFKRNDPRRATFLEQRGDCFEHLRFETRRGV